MQAEYQSNMLDGMLTAVIIGFLCAVFLDAERPASTGATAQTADLQVTESMLDNTPVQPAWHSENGWTLPAKHEGFLGFTGLKVVPEQRPELLQVSPMPVYTLAAPPLPGDDVPSFAPNEGGTGEDTIGGCDGIAISGFDGPLYIDERAISIFDLALGPEHGESVKQNVRLVRKVDPEVPELAQQYGREGEVDVLLYIDAAGQATPFSAHIDTWDQAAPYVERPGQSSNALETQYFSCRWHNGDSAQLKVYIDSCSSHNELPNLVLRENPKQYGFAINLLDVLPKWRFAPAVDDRQPVGQFVIIKFRYCFIHKPECQTLVIEGPQ
ncbi:MAG TPA: hypothetical protein VN285_10860 [Candidatus Deferrimicrobium sp.]|nr:hypothetical protein [Candidatus Deferrimicrobium sp.]